MKINPSFFLIPVLLAAPLASGDMVSDLVGRAEKGELVAQLELAAIYAKGEGVPKDNAAAARWFLKAAEQGDANAQFILGQRYSKDVAEAVKWFSKAAEQGHGEARMNLGGIYIAGKGVLKNSTEAAKWFLLSAEQGNPAAQCQIGRMHLTGAGVPKDDVEAYKWSNLASAQGNMAAKKVLVFLEKRMTPEQIAEGQKRSRDFLDRKSLEKTLVLPADLPADLPATPVEPE